MQRFSDTLVAFTTDLESGKPLEGVKVALENSKVYAVTNSEGVAVLENTSLALCYVVASVDGVNTVPMGVTYNYVG